MKTLRTPDERFANLPGFPFEPRHAHADDAGDGRRALVHRSRGARAQVRVLAEVAP